VSERTDNVALDVDERHCIRCGACSLLAPQLFEVGATHARITPRGHKAQGDDARLGRAAVLLCPTLALRARDLPREPPADTGEGPPSMIEGGPSANVRSYPWIARLSERVRWSLDVIDWSTVDTERASPALRALVREMAFSEHATYSATQKFMQTFAEDVDFTEWLAIWFYEETRHPHVLATWLRAVGEDVDDAFVQRGRVSTPFMRSKMGTLVTNLISEVTAASAYAGLAMRRQEPVLSMVARNICGDEARHAASFFGFAARNLAETGADDRLRLDALKVLHFWLNETSQVSHPINQMLEKLLEESATEGTQADPTRSSGSTSLAAQAADFDFDSVKRRITRLVGLLVGCDLRQVADVLPALTEMTRTHHASRRPDQ